MYCYQTGCSIPGIVSTDISEHSTLQITDCSLYQFASNPESTVDLTVVVKIDLPRVDNHPSTAALSLTAYFPHCVNAA